MSGHDEESSSMLGGRTRTNYQSINDCQSERLTDRSSSLSSADETSTEPASEDGGADSIPKSYKSWTKQQWLTLVTQNSLIFSTCLAYPLLSTFFPQEASKKGVSSFTTGLIFGSFEFVVFLTSPIFGVLMKRLTPRFMCLAGSFLAGGCCVLFGFLLRCPDGTIFVTMCFVLRIMNAIGCSMSNISCYVILSAAFPHHIGVVNSLGEAMAGLGFMLGPVVGAFLYDTGGFLLPFAVIGGWSLISTAFAFIGPKNINEKGEESKLKFYTLLTNPGIALLYVHVFGTSLALTFLDPIMAQWLEDNFKVSVTVVGLIFLIWSGVYTVTAPIMGKIVDKGFTFSLMISGGLICFLALLFMAPSPLVEPLFPDGKQLWVVCVACVMAGLGSAAMYIPPFVASINLIAADGHNIDSNVYGMISGLVTSSGSLGAFAGPTLAGYLNDEWGFDWTLTACAFIVLGVSLLMVIFCIVMKCRGRPLALVGSEDLGDATDTPSRKLMPAEDTETDALLNQEA